jgi:multiple sugar transport system substrate-binding protein
MTRRFSPRWGCLMALAWALILLAGCRPPEAALGAPDPQARATVDPALLSPERAAGRLPQVTLRVATGDSGDGLLPHRAIIAQFEKANPDIEVELESVASGDYYQYLLDAVATGRAPDIMQIGDDAVPLFVRRGILAELNPFMNGSNPLNPNIYLPGVFQPGAWRGKQYLLPKDFSSLAVYYNKKLFDQYHVPYPHDGWTWADFLQTARALTHASEGDPANRIWGVQLPADWTSGFEYWVAAAGGQLISEDGRRYTTYMDAPPAVRAAQFYAELYGKYQVAPPPANPDAFAGGNHEFVDGRAAMMILGRWPQAELRQNPKIDLGIVGMPAGIRRANVLFWSGFGIAGASTHKEAAWRFLHYYTGADAAQAWARWGLPTVTSVATQLGLGKDALEGVWLGELNYLVPRSYIFTDYWGSTADPALRRALAQLIRDPSPNAAQVMQSAALQAQAELDRSLR